MRISDWSLDVCSSDLVYSAPVPPAPCMLGKPQFEALSEFRFRLAQFLHFSESAARAEGVTPAQYLLLLHLHGFNGRSWGTVGELAERLQASRTEGHTSELQSLMRISYAVFCLQKKNTRHKD